jgi:hypothetical protein
MVVVFVFVFVFVFFVVDDDDDDDEWNFARTGGENKDGWGMNVSFSM